MEWNKVFLTPQLRRERFVSFVRAVGMSHGSYCKVTEFFLPVWGEGHQWVMG